MKMKKFLLIGLVLALSVSLAGCKDDTNNEQGNENQGTVNGGTTNNEGTATGDVSGDMITLIEDAEILVNAPYQDYITAEMAYNFVGLTEDEYTANIEEGVFYESMMSPANQSYCLLKVKDGADVEDLMQKVFDNVNPRKWICMSADRVLVMGDDSYIMLAMGTKESCDALKTEFATLAGDDNKEALDKTVGAGDDMMEGLPGMDDLYFNDDMPIDEYPEDASEEAFELDGVISGDDVAEDVSGEVNPEV